MEDKIDCLVGQIIEIDNRYYQCLRGHYCKDCDITNVCEARNSNAICDTICCISSERDDATDIVFKELIEIGKPEQLCGGIFQAYKYFANPAIIKYSNGAISTINNSDYTIAFKIDKIKKDAAKQVVFVGDKVKFNNIIYKCVLTEGCNKCALCSYCLKNPSPFECSRYRRSDKIGVMFVKIQNIKDMNLKPFNLEAAKAGKSVCTRDGRKARIICFDQKDVAPIVGLVMGLDGKESIYAFYNDGRVSNYEDRQDDLMMLPEKKEGWIKVRKDVNLYATKEEADRKMIGNTDYISAKVEWEE